MLILVRHGESMANAQGRLSGWQDVYLSERGKEQAIQVGIKLAAYPCHSVYSSDLVRAQTTASLAMTQWCRLKKQSKPPWHIRGALRERRMGQLQGKLKKNLRHANRLWPLKTWFQAPMEGESFYQLAQRVFPCIMRIPPQSIIFAHGGVIRMIAGIAQGIDQEKWMRWDIPNAEPICIEIPSNGWAHAVDQVKII